MSVSILEILDRAQQGPQVQKSDWDFDQVMMKTRQIVKKYELSWDRETIIPDDADLANRIFQAALELIQQTGVYYQDTSRVIQLDETEIRDGLASMPISLDLGEGEDVRTLFPRQVMDSRPPIVWAGNPGVPTPEDLFLPMVKSWIKEPIVDLVTCGSLTHIDGREVRTGEPTEILATRRELQLMRLALLQSGRPGMGMLAAQSSVSELGDLAVAHPDYLRTCDAHLVPMLNELIINRQNMARVVNSSGYGMFNASLPTVMVGGLAGDAPGTAVVQAASFMAANLVCQAHYHILHPIHIRHIATSTRSVMWVQGMVLQAFARNIPAIIVADIYPKSGAMTPELLYEVAANTITITVSGGHLEGVGAADGALPNATGLEARLMGEVAHAVSGQKVDLQQANHMVLRLLEKYEHVFTQAGGNPGVRFDRAYDIHTLEPQPAWYGIYQQVKSDLREVGLQL
jgi:methylamine--corrinoid protein Co-methyltransferase